MDCAGVREQLSLLLYGELSFDQEERIESHLDHCPDCRAALAREKALHAAFDNLEITPSPSLAHDCREDFLAVLLNEEAPPAPVPQGWWEKFTDAITLRPAGAFGVVSIGIVLGFAAAQMLPVLSSNGAFQSMGLGDARSSRVRYVEPASEGRVQIVLDETRQRIVSGRINEAPIRALLLTAAKDPSDPGLRAETIDILNTNAQAPDVRGALIFAVQHDQNAGVREKAMNGLQPFAQDPQVRAALAQVLLNDSNPGLRTQAIDLLIGGDKAGSDRQMVGTLQELMERGEQLGYVRERCRKALAAMNASSETY